MLRMEKFIDYSQSMSSLNAQSVHVGATFFCHRHWQSIYSQEKRETAKQFAAVCRTGLFCILNNLDHSLCAKCSSFFPNILIAHLDLKYSFLNFKHLQKRILERVRWKYRKLLRDSIQFFFINLSIEWLQYWTQRWFNGWIWRRFSQCRPPAFQQPFIY